MKTITINSKIIFIIISIVFLIYVYYIYKVFIKSTSIALINGDAVDDNGAITDTTTLNNFFKNIGISLLITVIIFILILILIFFNS